MIIARSLGRGLDSSPFYMGTAIHLYLYFGIHTGMLTPNPGYRFGYRAGIWPSFTVQLHHSHITAVIKWQGQKSGVNAKYECYTRMPGSYCVSIQINTIPKSLWIGPLLEWSQWSLLLFTPSQKAADVSSWLKQRFLLLKYIIWRCLSHIIDIRSSNTMQSM